MRPRNVNVVTTHTPALGYLGTYTYLYKRKPPPRYAKHHLLETTPLYNDENEISPAFRGLFLSPHAHERLPTYPPVHAFPCFHDALVGGHDHDLANLP